MSDELPLTFSPDPLPEPLDPERWETLRSLEEATGSGFLAELAGVFLEDTPKRLAGMRQGLAEGDARQVTQAAHSLKGSSSNIGAPLLESLAAELEGRCSGGSLEGVDGLLERIETEAERVCRALDAVAST